MTTFAERHVAPWREDETRDLHAEMMWLTMSIVTQSLFGVDVASENSPRYAYFPFGGGLRLCIGEPFAWMEGILLVATLAQRFCFRLAPSAHVEPQPLVTLRPKYGLPVTLHRYEEKLALALI